MATSKTSTILRLLTQMALFWRGRIGREIAPHGCIPTVVGRRV